MSLAIVPFTADHLDAAAALLAARHRRDRAWVPALSPVYEDPAAARPVLDDLLTADGGCGVVALRDGAVVSYLLGAPVLRSPTDVFAGFTHPRAAEIPYEGHAADPADGANLYPRLYAVLAQEWVSHGLVGHYITIPANPDSSEPWWDLGFGRYIALSGRATTPSAEHESRNGMDITTRRATPDDAEAVQALTTEFFRTVAAPPIFVPFLPETAAERQRFVADHLADPGCPVWLAFADDRLVGLQLFVEPTSSQWHQSPLATPQRAVYLFIVCTVPEARSSGVGAAFANRTLAWAREAGYDHCTAHYLTTSRANPFWRGLGFQPVSYGLFRAVDERVIWADGRI
ncbi:MAG TPA: GNAT family N-acetyltransferase [Thermomicrobiales bacterium]|nr:GNAT family N-acetyltransferase [Thermomicrobiales bacterium]